MIAASVPGLTLPLAHSLLPLTALLAPGAVPVVVVYEAVGP